MDRENGNAQLEQKNRSAEKSKLGTCSCRELLL